MPTHFAFSDDSRHQEDCFNSLCLVTLRADNIRSLIAELRKILKDSGISSEFKWSKLANAKYQFAAEKMIDFVWRNIDQLRIDILIWNNSDSRHNNVKRRDDSEDLVRMYYHLVATTCSKKWPISGVKWIWYPDEQSSVDWSILQECIRTKKHKCIANLFGKNPEFERVNILVKPAKSHNYSLIQLADLFAGLGAYSWGKFTRFKSWENQQNSNSLFGQQFFELSNREKYRFNILHDFRENCRKRDMKISLSSSHGLKSHNAKKRINFWMYDPQRPSDKAPTRH